MLNLDAHTLVWYVAGCLSPEEHRCLTGQDLAISAIVLWELAMLAQDSHLSFNLGHPEFQALLSCLRVFPINLFSQQKNSLDLPIKTRMKLPPSGPDSPCATARSGGP